MKKLFNLLVVLFFMIVFPLSSFGGWEDFTVNSGTWTSPIKGIYYYKNNRYRLVLTAAGDVSNNASITLNNIGMFDIAGFSSVVVNPDDTNIPASGYDLSITDGDGADIITGGQGTDLSTSSTTRIYLDLTHVCDSMTITFTGIGNGKQAELSIIFDKFTARKR